MEVGRRLCIAPSNLWTEVQKKHLCPNYRKEAMYEKHYTMVMEYELIDIEWGLDYSLIDDVPSPEVRDDAGEHLEDESKELHIEYDANGIPMGNTPEDFQKRKTIIEHFWVTLREQCQNPSDFRILNKALNEYIYLVHNSFVEATMHSARNYKSTIAFLRLKEIVENAKPVARVQAKAEDKNQRCYEKMLIMVYDIENLGKVKLTVGLRRRKSQDETHKKEEYAITVLEKNQILVTSSKNKKSKKTSHRE